MSQESHEVIRNIANRAQTMMGIAIWNRRASRRRFGNAMIASETRDGASPAPQPTPGAQAGAAGSRPFAPALRPPPSPATSRVKAIVAPVAGAAAPFSVSRARISTAAWCARSAVEPVGGQPIRQICSIRSGGSSGPLVGAAGRLLPELIETLSSSR